MKTTAFSTTALAVVLVGVHQVVASDTVNLNTQTWYGWPDNGGNAETAYDCLGRGTTAGGDGSYGNPLTYATASGSYLHSPCEISWFPYLEKYLVMQDTCGSCSGDQIDVWISNDQGGQSELDCENNSNSGNGHNLVRGAASGNSANTNELWSFANGCQVNQNSYPGNS